MYMSDAPTGVVSQPESVAIYVPHLKPGGMELSLLTLARELHDGGVQVTMLVHRLDSPPSADRMPVPIVPLQVNGTVQALPALTRYLRRHRPTYLLSALPHNNLIAILATRLSAARTKVIVTEHAPIAALIDQHRSLRYRVLSWLIPLIYPWADAIVGVSEGVCSELRQMLPSRVNVDVIYNAIVPTDLASRTAQTPDHPWFGPDAGPVILAVGRLSPEKGYPNLLRAFADICTHYPDVRLAILGEGSQRPMLSNLITALGLQDRACLVGHVVNPYAYMSHARMLVVASTFEGFGNVLVEAMACNIPVISTDCPVGPREILKDGQFGQLVRPGNIAALAQAMRVELETTRDLDQAYSRAMEFTVGSSVAHYWQLFNRLENIRVVKATPAASSNKNVPAK